MVKIGHAVQDENGGSKGLQPGDQTGKEILVANWYKRSGGWQYYIEPVDKDMADKAVEWMIAICESPLFGYSKSTRWTGYKNLVKNDKKIDGCEAGNFDCSSLVISCYIFAGLDHPASGYTGSIVKSFRNTGKFKIYEDDKYLTTSDYAKKGSLYLTEGKHVAMVLENGPKADEDPEPGPKIPRVEILGNVWIRKEAGADKPKVRIARKGESFDWIETVILENGDEWYRINEGYASAFTGKKRKYTRLVAV